ncbi:RNA polymerase sigma-70 factor (ECF subfamily) [Catenulispora sp. GP43]|uniref:sigma-70 family RNA polymerase sigma factor n=1 Tax=Catenulispora sp. GP43 TaxID=3156263 RepID=UPI0035196740
MTDLPSPNQRGALSDSELDALLAVTDADLLRYAAAKTDQARLLLTLLEADDRAESESVPSEAWSFDQVYSGVSGPEPAAPAGLLLLHKAVRAVTISDYAWTGPDADVESGSASSSDDRDQRFDVPVDESDVVVGLVAKAKEGDADAFGELYRIYCDTVFRYIYYRVSTRALAEDLTSETFVRALRRITTFSWRGRDFGAWLVAIARNLVADHLRSSRHRMEVSTGEMLDSNEVEASPEDSVLNRLSNETLLEAVHRLDDQQRECVALRFLRGLSAEETAEIMGESEDVVRVLSHRALRALSRIVAPELGDGSRP